MVRFILLVFLFSFHARADFFSFGNNTIQSKIPALVEKLKKIEMGPTAAYEEAFNQAVKSIEVGIEEEKLICSGEASDEKGRTLPLDKRQLCMRELKNHYLEAMDTIFELKKKYLGMLHSKQIDQLEEIHKNLKSDIEKKF
ncbi:MAG: hypothetical protein AB7I27_12130 [Bacteriovoracaceae bacterium]